LLGVDREDGEVLLDEGFHQSPVRDLDRHRELLGVVAAEAMQPIQQLHHPLAIVVDPAMAEPFSLRIHAVDAVLFRCPVDAYVPLKVGLQRFPFRFPTCRSDYQFLYWRSAKRAGATPHPRRSPNGGSWEAHGTLAR
jgi:hypothetical protein